VLSRVLFGMLVVLVSGGLLSCAAPWII